MLSIASRKSQTNPPSGRIQLPFLRAYSNIDSMARIHRPPAELERGGQGFRDSVCDLRNSEVARMLRFAKCGEMIRQIFA